MNDNATPIISGHGLVKHYGDFKAVNGIDFDVYPGECFGFLGPNGAGKTTTIKMMTCVSPVTEGTLTVDGLDVTRDQRTVKARIGVVPQEDNLDPDLSVQQNLVVYSRYFGIPKKVALERIDEGLSLFSLQEKRNEQIDALSGGMKRRLTIARALINDPPIVVLDEPTTGLDPQARHLVWQKLRLLKARGVTMILTTHYMDEAAHLCDRLVIMHQGKILVEGRPRDLIKEYAGDQVVEVHVLPEEREGVLEGLGAQPRIEIEDVEDILYLFGVNGAVAGVEQLLGDPGRIIQRHANLEDVFLRLTGRGLLE
jgi:lipooligosaccharide transport system ATP-binding protein